MRNNDDMNTANTAVVRSAIGCSRCGKGDPRSRSIPTRCPPAARDLAQRSRRRAVLRASAAGARRQRVEFRLARLLRRDGLLIWHIGADGALVRTAVLESPRAGLPAQLRDDRQIPGVRVHAVSDERGRRSFFETHAVRARSSPVASPSCPRTRSMRRAGSKRRSRPSITSLMPTNIAAKSSCAPRGTRLEEARSPMAAEMRGERGTHERLSTELVSLHLDLARNRRVGRRTACAVSNSRPSMLARPATGPRCCLRPASVAPWTRPTSTPSPASYACGSSHAHRYGADVMSEEHRFVPRPGRARPAKAG